MHILKKRLDEIPNQHKEKGCFILPDELFETELTFEEKIVYMYFCYYKSNSLELPDIEELARKTELKPGMVSITLNALSEKGITF